MEIKIITKQKETYINHAICECGGEYKFDNVNNDIILTIFGAVYDNQRYPHKCDKCGKIESFPKTYPEEVIIERMIPQNSKIVKLVQNK